MAQSMPQDTIPKKYGFIIWSFLIVFRATTRDRINKSTSQNLPT